MNSVVNPHRRSQQNEYQSETASSQLFPEGTCDRKTNKLLSDYKNLLNGSDAQSLIFPLSSNYFPWVIVRQTPSGQQPIFHLYYEISNKRFLSAQKQANNIGCNFMISKKQRPKKDENFVAKLRGNFRNTEFFVYDNGENPKKKCSKNRKQLAYIRLNDESIFSQLEEQKIQALIPSVDEQNLGKSSKFFPRELTPNDQKQNLLLDEYKKKSSKVINLFQKRDWASSNTESQWSLNSKDAQEKAKKLNFRFQMNENKNNFPVLSLSTRNRKTFNLNFGYPLNMVQSFGIALALIQRVS